jgi:dephospho-CoA kinase
MRKFIIFIGASGSGKDTSYEAIQHLGYKRYAFADHLKEIVKVMFHLTQHDVTVNKNTPLDKWYGKTPRELVQFIGTEVLQYKINELIPELHRNYHCKILTDNIKQEGNNLIVITDLRFHHELNYLISEFPEDDIYVVKIIRPSLDLNESFRKHISETELNEITYDYVIHNDKNKQEFVENVRKLNML